MKTETTHTVVRNTLPDWEFLQPKGEGTPMSYEMHIRRIDSKEFLPAFTVIKFCKDANSRWTIVEGLVPVNLFDGALYKPASCTTEWTSCKAKEGTPAFDEILRKNIPSGKKKGVIEDAISAKEKDFVICDRHLWQKTNEPCFFLGRDMMGNPRIDVIPAKESFIPDPNLYRADELPLLTAKLKKLYPYLAETEVLASTIRMEDDAVFSIQARDDRLFSALEKEAGNFIKYNLPSEWESKEETKELLETIKLSIIRRVWASGSFKEQECADKEMLSDALAEELKELYSKS